MTTKMCQIHSLPWTALGSWRRWWGGPLLYPLPINHSLDAYRALPWASSPTHPHPQHPATL